MKPTLEYLPKRSDESFVTKWFDYPFYPTPWHFHPEYELVLVTESKGKRFVGDNISRFAPGNLALLGSYLPHTYRNNDEYYKSKSRLRAKSIVVHFTEQSFGDQGMKLPEMQAVQNLLTRSVRGLEVSGKTNAAVCKRMNELMTLEGLSRWLKLLEILNILAHSTELRYISNHSMIGNNRTETERMNTILQFVGQSFNREITVSEIAGKVSMAPNSFSRYFSQRTRKSFTSYVNEVRLNHASVLLIETNKTVIEISLDCGFGNLSNFNRQFRNTYGVSPLQFKKQYQFQ